MVKKGTPIVLTEISNPPKGECRPGNVNVEIGVTDISREKAEMLVAVVRSLLVPKNGRNKTAICYAARWKYSNFESISLIRCEGFGRLILPLYNTKGH